MTTRKKQLGFDELEGKTIKRVFSEYDENMLIVFDDQTFCSLSCYGDSCSDDLTIDNGDFRLADWDKYGVELLELGVITGHQLQQHLERKASLQELSKENRRRQYEALKVEFETKNDVQ